MKRSIQQWQNMIPAVVCAGSEAQALFCVQDAQADIVELYQANYDAAKVVNEDTKIIANLKTENARLREALEIITANARLIPDPNMAGTTDCWAVPLDDIVGAVAALDGDKP